MYSIHGNEDLSKLNQLARKKNILARFVMNGCPYCVQSQPEWDSFSKQDSEFAFAEIESNFLDHFKNVMSKRNASIQVTGFPTILLIRDSNVSIVPSLQQLKLKRKKSKRNLKRTKKTRVR